MINRKFFIIQLIILINLFSCTINKRLDIRDIDQIDIGNINQLKDGYKNGLWIETINKEDIQIVEYKLDKKEGVVIILYKDGRKGKFMYSNDKKNGKAYIYDIGYIEQIYENDSLIKTIIHSPSW